MRRVAPTLADTVGVLDDGPAARPSLLPGWLVGHGPHHLARNADSYVRMLDGAAGGQALEQYAGGHEQRSADIDAGATRPAAEVVADLFAATHRLEAAFDRTTAATWGRHGLIRETPARAGPSPDPAGRRWRSTTSTWGLAYTAADWSEDYVAVELPGVLGDPERPAGRPRPTGPAAGLALGPGRAAGAHAHRLAVAARLPTTGTSRPKLRRFDW